MEIYLIRHTEPDIEKGICYGNSDIGIKLPIEKDIDLILKKIVHKVDVIYSSPLLRCSYLSKKLQAKMQTKLLLDERLKELNFGDWEMKKWDSINQTDLMRWMNNYEIESCPNGESYLDLKLRATSFLNELKNLNLKTIVIVSHGGFIRTCISIVCQQSFTESMNQKVDYGCVINLSY